MSHFFQNPQIFLIISHILVPLKSDFCEFFQIFNLLIFGGGGGGGESGKNLNTKSDLLQSLFSADKNVNFLFLVNATLFSAVIRFLDVRNSTEFII